MIHFRLTLDEIRPAAPPSSEPPTSIQSLPFRRPADYYSAPVGEARPLFPRWVPYGCGSAAIILLIAVFLGGIFASRGGMGEVLDLMFGSMQSEIDKIFTKDVQPAQRAAFDREMKTMRTSVRQNRLPIDRLQPLLRTLREVTSDSRVTSAETEQLTKEIHAINSVGAGSPAGTGPAKGPAATHQ